MRERAGQILKAATLVLAAVLLYQLVQAGLRVNPLSKVVIPALPRLASDTNTPDGGKGMTSSNQLSTAKGTNAPAKNSGTNSSAAKAKLEKGTNLVPGDLAKAGATNNVGPLTPALSPSAGERENGSPRTNELRATTNSHLQAPSGQETQTQGSNSPAQTSEQKAEKPETNLPPPVSVPVDATNNSQSAPATNASPSTTTVNTKITLSISSGETNIAASGTNSTLSLTTSDTNNLSAQSETNVSQSVTNAGTPPPPTIRLMGAGESSGIGRKQILFKVSLATNGLPVTNTAGTNLAAAGGTNSTARPKSKGTNSAASPAIAMGGMNPSSMRGGGKAAELPPEIKARVDRIYESELFGMVMRPVPMGLLGIAGNSAFLRSPSGQTGLVKEGDSLGEIKLLRIGINRVLVEQDGKKTELTIFDGYGGESLMPKDKETAK